MQPHRYTVKERDMVLKNTELSFTVRRQQESVTELEKQNKELVSDSKVYMKSPKQLSRLPSFFGTAHLIIHIV